MIVHLGLALEVRIDHLSYGRRPIYRMSILRRKGPNRYIPGNFCSLTFLPSFSSRLTSRATWVDLPERSSPSKTMNAPLVILSQH